MNKTLLFLSLFFVAESFTQTISSEINPYIMVRFKQGVDGKSFLKEYQPAICLPYKANRADYYNFRKISSIFNIYSVYTFDSANFIKACKKSREVLKVGYDQPLEYRNAEPNDSHFDEQWNMKNIRADLVWEETTGGQTIDGKRIVVGVLEKGIDPTHEDLVDNIWKNEAEIPNNGIDDDNNGYVDDYLGLNLIDLSDIHTADTREGERTAHGTQVAGVIGAKGNNDMGITGVNWDIDLLIFSKVSLASHVIEAQEYAYQMRKKFNETEGREGAFIVALNHSFGFDGKLEDFDMGMEMCQMMDLSGQVGILSVVATYNDPLDVDEVGDVLPNCTSDFVIAVTSSNEQNEQERARGYGATSIDLAAPGEQIFTLDLDNDYGLVSGTSLAAPLVAGTIGLLYSLPCEQLGTDAIANPKTTATFMKEIILNGVQPLSNDNATSTVTNGRLDAFAAMASIQLYCGKPESVNFSIMELYPNPATTQLNLVFETPDFEDYQLSITNTLGQTLIAKTVKASRFVENQLIEDVSFFPSGNYFLTLGNSERKITKRFIVEN